MPGLTALFYDTTAGTCLPLYEGACTWAIAAAGSSAASAKQSGNVRVCRKPRLIPGAEGIALWFWFGLVFTLGLV